MSKSISSFFTVLKEKRKLSSTSSSEGESSPGLKQVRKKIITSENLDVYNTSTEEEMDSTELQETLKTIQKRLQLVATAEDVMNLGKRLEETIVKLESRFFDLEQKMDVLQQEANMVKEENSLLREKLQRLECAQNDSDQYNRRWNVRIYNVQEKAGETPEDCVSQSCKVFTDLLGVKTSDKDLEAAHRTGKPLPGRKRPRPIIVRFTDRRLRDRVIAEKRKLKGKGVTISEDLTAANYSLQKAAFTHSATLATWTSRGKVLAKLKNGKTVQIPYGCDVNKLLLKEMSGGGGGVKS